MLHTREIITRLSYKKLLEEGVIPDILSIINKNPKVITNKRYPPFVYEAKDFAFFGMLMDYLIRAGLRNGLSQTTELGIDPTSNNIQNLPDIELMEMIKHLNIYETSKNIHDISQSALELVSFMYNKHPYNYGQINGYVPTIINIINEVIIKWKKYGSCLNGIIKYNAEYCGEQFFGHPDIVVGDTTVLDIKNTASFPKMAEESCLQILTYYALMKLTIPTMKYVGFVLPMQRDVILCDVDGWDSTEYLQLLECQANNIIVSQKEMLQSCCNHDGDIDLDKLFSQFGLGPRLPEEYHIGSHVSKGKNIVKTLMDYMDKLPNCPVQMFLTNPRTGKRDQKTFGQLAASKELIEKNNLLYFTHAPYVINLCTNQYDGKEYWMQRILNEELQYTVLMGGKGVVVHIGAKKNLSEDEALNTMEHMIRTALAYATEDCPLCLETCCAEGTEVLFKLEDLGDFYMRFTETERKKLGLIVDTCHVFSSNYDPLDYLERWVKYSPISIKLVHFNDSKGVRGCCSDRHAPPGQGYIGMEKMLAVAKWCHERNIPMVRE